MKFLLFTLAVFMLMAQLVSGNWYLKKCANKSGNCRKKCRNGEMQTQPSTSRCPRAKICCI
uniref:Beta-defensin n=1 Tax=Loxodonta africana TaxID=9785 RepID=G3TIW1_LOXAF